MLLNTGESWDPEENDILMWVRLYPAVDIQAELRAMEGWLYVNERKRKTAKGIKRFCNSWLAKAQDKGGSPMAKSGIIIKTREMSALDSLTDDFADSESFRQSCLAKHGQYFKDGVRHTQ